MKRREFIAHLGASTVWPVVARAQHQPMEKLPRIGTITNFPNENFEAFIQGLREAGYVVGRNVLVESRFHGSAFERIHAFAVELVDLKCSVLFTAAPYGIDGAMKATSTIPIVGVDLESDPVAKGWVKSLARPAGNFTGLFLDIPELAGKQIELLKEAVPTISHLAILWDATIGLTQFQAAQMAMNSSRITVASFPIRDIEQ